MRIFRYMGEEEFRKFLRGEKIGGQFVKGKVCFINEKTKARRVITPSTSETEAEIDPETLELTVADFMGKVRTGGVTADILVEFETTEHSNLEKVKDMAYLNYVIDELQTDSYDNTTLGCISYRLDFTRWFLGQWDTPGVDTSEKFPFLGYRDGKSLDLEVLEKVKDRQMGQLPKVIDDQYVEQVFQKIVEEKGPYSFVHWGLCGQDVSEIDMSNLSPANFRRLTFDSKTIFSNEQKEHFHPEELLEQGKKFTEGMERLHKAGINGTGINIGLIDSGFDSAIPEFNGTDGRSRVHDMFGEPESDDFHGKTTACLATGKECGVAPNSELYLYRTDFSQERLDEILQHIIDSIDSKEVKLDILSMSALLRGKPGEEIPTKTQELVNKLEERGIAFIYSERFMEDFALGRISDGAITLDEWLKGKGEWLREQKELPHEFESFREAIENMGEGKNVILPCSGRTSVQIEGKGYKYNGGVCGNSFAIPQVAGLFAIARQKNPNIQYDEFVEIARGTAVLNSDNMMYINPEGIVREINERNNAIRSKTQEGTASTLTTTDIGKVTIDAPTETKMTVVAVEQSEMAREARENEGEEYNGK